MRREKRLLNGANRSTRILEIGPGYNPIASKRAGWNTHVIDHASREELRRKYAGAPVDLEAFEEVDTIWSDGPLHEAVAAELHGTFDLLIASHVIEHVPDFVGFLSSAAVLLKPDGVVSLAVPDRRYCFDYFKPPSSTGDVLEAYVSRRTRHSIRSLWNHTAYAITMNGSGAWGQHAVSEPRFIASFEDATAVQRTARNDPDEYTDCHAWQFTPAAFRLVMLELAQLGLIDWRIANLTGPEGCEFLTILQRGAERVADPDELQRRRMALLRDQLTELREQVDFMAAGTIPAAGPSAAAAPVVQRMVRRLRRFRKPLRLLSESMQTLADPRRSRRPRKAGDRNS
jgi:hypothetical protein